MTYPYNFYGGYYGQPAPDQLAQLRQQQFQQPQMQQSAMVWVRNRAEADAYPVAPNTAIALWDMSGPYVHRKETDVSGRPMIKTYQLVEAADAVQTGNNSGGEFITRREFQMFVDSIKSQTSQKEETDNA